MRCAVCMVLQKTNRQTLLGAAAITYINGTAYCEQHLPKDFVKEHKKETPLKRDEEGKIGPKEKKPKVETTDVAEKLEKDAVEAIKETKTKPKTRRKTRKKGKK